MFGSGGIFATKMDIKRPFEIRIVAKFFNIYRRSSLMLILMLMLMLMIMLMLTVILSGTMTQSTTNISLIDTEIVLRQSSITTRVAGGYEGKFKYVFINKDTP